jgi:GNAT superfamily N-acetyltransferase
VHLNVISPATIDEALALLAGADTGLGSPVAERIVTADHLQRSFADRQRRPAWVWCAVREGRTVGRVAAWGSPERDLPWIIDLVDPGVEPDRVEVTAGLLSHAADALGAAGLDPVELNLHVAVGWRSAANGTLPDVLDAASAAGFQLLITRRRFCWTGPDIMHGIGPELRFEPVSGVDDPALVDAYRRTFAGTLDAHTLRSLEIRDPHELALGELADMAHYAGPVDGWRLAYDGTGDLVGLVTGGVGSRGMIGYVGVVPEHRGRGHARRLLGWMTQWLSDHGAAEVIGETDDANRPMGDAFVAVGFVEEGGRIDVVRPSAVTS